MRINYYEKKIAFFIGALIISTASYAVMISTSCGWEFEFDNSEFDSVQEMVDMANTLEDAMCG